MPTLNLGAPGSTGSWNGTSWGTSFFSWNVGNSNRKPGARWAGVAVPQGATITSATLSFTLSRGVNSGAVGVHQVDNAPALASGQHTTVFTPTGGWPIGSGPKTVDLTAGVQALVNRPGWAAGNALTVRWEGVGDSSASATLSAVTLTVEYVDPVQEFTAAELNSSISLNAAAIAASGSANISTASLDASASVPAQQIKSALGLYANALDASISIPPAGLSGSGVTPLGAIAFGGASFPAATPTVQGQATPPPLGNFDSSPTFPAQNLKGIYRLGASPLGHPSVFPPAGIGRALDGPLSVRFSFNAVGMTPEVIAPDQPVISALPHDGPPQEAIDAFIAGTTQHTKRLEFYERDAETRWMPDYEPQLEAGSINGDHGRDERRTIEVTLNNSDGKFISSPGGLWYDKIIKAYAGVRIPNPKKIPRIAIMVPAGYSNAQVLRECMTAIGFGEARLFDPDATMAQLREYDIIGAVATEAASTINKLNALYEESRPVFTVGQTSKALFAPAVGAAVATTVLMGSDDPIINPPGFAHPAGQGWSAFLLEYLDTDYTLSTLNLSGIPGFTVLSSAGNASLFAAKEDTLLKKKWAMISLQADEELLEMDEFRAMLKSALNWINPITPLYHWETQVGEFMIDRISEPHFPPIIKITGRDYAKKCMNSKYAYATQFDAGQSLEQLIATIAGAAGITKRILPVTGQTVSRDFFFDRGTTRWAAMKEIATSYNYELYFDAQGYLVMSRLADPATDEPDFTFKTGGPHGTLVSYEKSSTDTRLYNVIVVSGESSDATVLPVYAIARNDDPNSPTSTLAVGERVFEYTSGFIETAQQAQEIADTYLSIYAMEEYDLSLSSLVLPWLEVGRTVRFVDPNPAPDDPDTFLLSSLTYPLGLEEMSGNAKRVIRVNP